ncbi:MAG TPA: hypothetical protein EYN28_07730 [Flavobacteriales bacterium]|jgi:hypothetical protein|nr:hypothetical protein [Flavobacteriales bacterium]HIB76274.1 hypothetical protein [Flavobacteriales bacterium]HIN41191.1 hypothetical protein [Flavobacteriales bacterium]HIO16559.1 hypothetical protein [Flavobacteriales bacterium]HIO60050.1 hypothetical protein [Flavobacteriales bacterium]
MIFSATSLVPWWCFVCIICGSVPEWPEGGVANRDWVVEALEWRLDRGVGRCKDVMPVIDAWTLEWIANSSEIRVEIQTEKWPVFTAEPKLQGPLIQIMALEELKGRDYNAERILRKLRRFARKSDGVWSEELKEKFEETKNLGK